MFIGSLFEVLSGGFGSEVSYREILRVSNNKANLDAIVVETNGGATTSFGYYVYIVRKGQKISEDLIVASFDSALKDSNSSGLNLDWVGQNKLEISYFRAKSVNLITRKFSKFGFPVEIQITN